MENPAQKFKTLFICTWNESRREVLQRFDSSENPGFARKPSCLSASQSTIGFSAKSRKRGVFRQNRKVATLPRKECWQVRSTLFFSPRNEVAFSIAFR